MANNSVSGTSTRINVAGCMPLNSALDVQAQLCTCRSDDYMSAHLDISYSMQTLVRDTSAANREDIHMYVPPGLHYFVELL